MEELYTDGIQKDAAPRPSLWKQAATYGIFYALLSILISVIVYATGSMMSEPVQYITILVTIVAVILIQLHYRKMLGGTISYGQAVGIVVLSLLFAAIPVGIYTYCLYKFIDPGLIDQMMLNMEEKLVEQGSLSQDMIEDYLTLFSKFQTPGFMGMSQVLNLPLTGLIIGLISSIFVRKVSPDKIFE
ncbi:MAG: DUF4199 domain-containing protein [Prolixibacteraceae bacterium]|jgi:hypothetical protein|nr:DUF4199 domain-containing protein [Prolixibacteraceae bacterium]MDI9563669.1 DUF4199 domain-containing protein [Bacteroidota bacterium]NLT00648.1 DUF4199 domain-containing protein [Bacteroidales bacterium]OQB80003.1 MAG: hypothetical protein BWX87_01704 [Bacteroidetes bacterium ADurb.Bin123]HNZ68267.1 DUF4199 domain-containing protein [Prolixibacteraceae bacterium]